VTVNTTIPNLTFQVKASRRKEKLNNFFPPRQWKSQHNQPLKEASFWDTEKEISEKQCGKNCSLVLYRNVTDTLQ